MSQNELLLHIDGSKEVNFTDNNGSVRLTVHNGGGIHQYDYKPFGDTLWTSGGNMSRDNFDGSTYDSESDLQMLGFRMYDNETGRFTTPDLLWSAFPAQTPYHYAYNSPLTYRDPSGLAPEKEKEGEELMGWTFDGKDNVYIFTGVEVTASRIWNHDLHDFLYESYLNNEENNARLGEMQDWWMNSVYNWKGPAGTTDYVSLKGNAKLSPNPNDKSKKEKADLTKEFNEHLDKSDKLFREITILLLRKMPLIYSINKVTFFGMIQYEGRNTDFFNPKQSKTYEDGGKYLGEEFRADDFGNYLYGSAAFSMGLSIEQAIWGAGAFGIINGSVKDYRNYFGLFDDTRDTWMIIRGYYRKRWEK